MRSMIFATFVLAALCVCAQDSEPVSKEAAPEDAPWVFIPVDATGNPAGEQYYVPVEMFRQMQTKSPAAPRTNEPKCLFHSALYSGTLTYPLATRQVTFEPVEAVFDIEVNTPNTRLAFPFSSDEIYISPGGMQLNGAVLPVKWDNRRLLADIAKPGRYTLKIEFLPILGDSTPPVSETPAASGPPKTPPSPKVPLTEVRFSIPPIANARLEFEVPPGFTNVDFPSAAGKSIYVSESHLWQVQLGGVGAMHIRWKLPYSVSTASGLPSAEELYRWKFSRSQMSIQCRFRVRPTRDAVQELQWLADSRLQFDLSSVDVFQISETSPASGTSKPPTLSAVPVDTPLPANGETAAGAGSAATYRKIPSASSVNVREEGDCQRISITFEKPAANPIFVQFTLKQPNSSGVGNLAFPFIRTENARLTRRWVNVQSERNLQLALPENSTAATVSYPEFQTAWQEVSQSSETEIETPGAPASFVLDDLPQAGNWTVRSQPIPEISTAQEVFSCLFDTAGVKVHHVLQFPSLDAVPPLYYVDIPAPMTVENVVLHTGYQQKSLRFARISPTRVSVFNDPRPGARKTSVEASNCQIVLTGNLAGTSEAGEDTAGRAVPFPSLKVVSNDLYIPSRIVNVYRTSSILVAWPTTESSSVPNPAGSEGGASTYMTTESAPLPFENARLVTSIPASRQEKLPSEVQVRANQPEIRVQSRTSILPQVENESEVASPSWRVSVDLELDVTDGLLDEFTLEIPQTMCPPLELEPALPFTLEPVTHTCAVPENTASEGAEGETSAGAAAADCPEPTAMRLRVRPAYPLSGTSHLRISSQLCESPALKEDGTSIALPVIRFPQNVQVVQEVELPQSPQTFEWSLEGLTPVENSEKKPANSGVRRYRVVSDRYGARLQSRGPQETFPTVLWMSHEIEWGAGDRFPGLALFDVLPQKSLTCTLRVPVKLEILEFRLNSQPVQAEEVFWNPDTKNFESAAGSELEDASRPRFYRVTLHSLHLPQRLEVLYYGSSTLHTLGTQNVGPTLSNMEKLEKTYRLDLPELVAIQDGRVVPSAPPRGECFLFVPEKSQIQLRSLDTNGQPAQAVSLRPTLRVELVCLEEIVTLTKIVSEMIPPSDASRAALSDEKSNWLALWSQTWTRDLSRFQNALEVSGGQNSEYQKDFTALREEGITLFSAVETARQNPGFQSLQKIFRENLPAASALVLAFDTDGDSAFCLTESVSLKNARPKFMFSSIFVLLLTILILVVLFLCPGIIEKTRTAPFWLFVLGVVWILCELMIWVALILFVSAFVLFIVRFHFEKMKKKS